MGAVGDRGNTEEISVHVHVNTNVCAGQLNCLKVEECLGLICSLVLGGKPDARLLCWRRRADKKDIDGKPVNAGLLCCMGWRSRCCSSSAQQGETSSLFLGGRVAVVLF